MTELKTKDSLLKALRRASSRALTAEEIEKQRLSFVMGTLKPENDISREKVKEILQEQIGKRAS
jgi:hypothetical protein